MRTYPFKNVYFMVITETIDNAVVFQNELTAANYDEAQKEAETILALFCRDNRAQYRMQDLYARVEKRILAGQGINGLKEFD